MDKKTGAYKTIGEVSKEINVPAHILRFWESKFDRLKLIKRKNSHRYYNKEDILFLIFIKKLINEDGLTIQGVQRHLKKNKKITEFSSTKEKDYLYILNEIKNDINNIINNK